MEDDVEDDVEDDLETFLAVVFLDLVIFRAVFVFLLNILDLFFWLVTLVELDGESAEESASADGELDSSCFDFSLFPESAFLGLLTGFLIRVNFGCFFFELG